MRTYPLSSFLGLGAALAALGLAGCTADKVGSGELPSPGPESEDGDPETVDGNPDCGDLGLGDFSFKTDDPATGTYDLDAYNQVTVDTDGTTFDWSATIGIDAVIVKGGPNASIYEYDPEAVVGAGLHAPINPNTGEPFDISHIEFCYDYEVEVEKTAATSFTRDWDWSITKTGSATDLMLALAQHYQVDYTVEVTATGYADSDFAVAGTITVFNPAPIDATVTAVTDELDGAPIAVDCGASFPVTLAPGESLECSYASDLADASGGTNVATADTEGDVGPGSGSAPVDFAGAEITEIDGCVEVTDDQHGDLGTVCAADSPATFEYSTSLGSQSCGAYDYVNVASYHSADGESGSASWTVHVEVECDPGCSLTPGYWKTHSEYGPAPYDDIWAQLPDGADTAFFLSGQSWYEMFMTESTNAYYILARAYGATFLNSKNGADTSSVADELAAAESMLSQYSPADIAALEGDDELRATWIATAAVLDDYNNGLLGVPHCDEDANSAL